MTETASEPIEKHLNSDASACHVADPEMDDWESRRRYRKAHAGCVYAVIKRQLSRRELHRRGLGNPS
jgi:hypothetical protein